MKNVQKIFEPDGTLLIVAVIVLCSSWFAAEVLDYHSVYC